MRWSNLFPGQLKEFRQKNPGPFVVTGRMGGFVHICHIDGVTKLMEPGWTSNLYDPIWFVLDPFLMEVRKQKTPNV